ncbi:MAG: toll/interleukin-1 receptor domain-containing protein [Rhodospirillales bacterium]|nr:toll/interleukin-1 receptor domain-containing protein [Rhodospirillales bacterium]
MTTLFISHSSKDKAWAERTHQALTAGGYHCLFLDSHPDDGIHAGADWEQTLYQRLRQSRGVVVLCSANWLASPCECPAAASAGQPRHRRRHGRVSTTAFVQRPAQALLCRRGASDHAGSVARAGRQPFRSGGTRMMPSPNTAETTLAMTRPATCKTGVDPCQA